MCKFENNERNSQLKMAGALNLRECATEASGKRDFEGKREQKTDRKEANTHA